MGKTQIAKSISLLRKCYGYSQREIGELTGVTKQAISMYERGERTPEPEFLEKLADIYKVDINVIYGRKQSVYTEEIPEDIIIYHRDGVTMKKHFTKEQMNLLLTMIDAIPGAKETEDSEKS
jgi:transcriptional regulator with XRE-family HTH domain